MTSLVLELRQGESMIVNGAVIRFKTRTRLELSTQARFLFGRQIMRAEDATTPARQAYYALQQAYIAPEAGRAAAMASARGLVAGLRDAAPEAARRVWEALLDAVGEDAGFKALKLARELIRAEAFANV
ncbi:flagellar biosynthesis repressor FlbT [Acidocella sp. KAb 2-4]|uniref:flagellar biosynthesis repressor FlbT n=1 Tax=Acidocella sp. KAb 2-4 TaxID=2885158 RepID=UPI001D08B52D|nr:flagellar biosynthesis repressor FlbT [Acidocella sp. KAb 2-4]MCB5945221.1 flagellar biosynthesis repressor FlbT [Acidocella sp. KAb 2-4]